MQDNISSENNRIAKNTLLLYGRMLLLLVISLYTSRIILAGLGVEDYGLYNVVGGVVIMFTFLNSAMGNSSHRYIAYALGREDFQETKNVVCATKIIHCLIAVAVLVLAETIGLWFLHNKMTIPESRMVAAEWVYQFSIVACMLSIISVPYNAMIIAHEKMGAFAIISVIDALLKFLIAFQILISDQDRLILYGALMLGVSFLDFAIYRGLCIRYFAEAKSISFKRVPHLKEVASFAGWSLIGNLASVGYTQGLNILLNLFFGPTVNAARGIAVQVQSAIKGFVNNVQTAINPQIVKTYAKEDYNRMHSLVYASSKFSFFLLYCMVLPIIIESKEILKIWLKDVPENAVLFTNLTLVVLLIDPLCDPIDRSIQATGKIRTYQVVEGGLLLLIVPISYFILKQGGEPYSVFVVQIIVAYIVQIVRLFIVCPQIKMSKRVYFKRVLFRVALVAIASSVIPLIIYNLLPQTLFSFLLVVITSVISVMVVSFFLGLTTKERFFVMDKCQKFFSRISNRRFDRNI